MVLKRCSLVSLTPLNIFMMLISILRSNFLFRSLFVRNLPKTLRGSLAVVLVIFLKMNYILQAYPDSEERYDVR